MPIEWFVTASCYVLVSFHHQNWCFISIFCCHLCRCESYFVWHEWDIFCLIKFKLCSASVRFGLIWFGSDVWRVHGYTVLCVWCNFNADGFSWFVVVVVISLSLSLDFNAKTDFACVRLSIALVNLCLENALLLLQLATQNVRVMPMQTHRIVINYTEKIISETFCHAVFLSHSCSIVERMGERKRDEMIFLIIILCLIWLNYYDT